MAGCWPFLKNALQCCTPTSEVGARQSAVFISGSHARSDPRPRSLHSVLVSVPPKSGAVSNLGIAAAMCSRFAISSARHQHRTISPTLLDWVECGVAGLCPNPCLPWATIAGFDQ